MGTTLDKLLESIDPSRTLDPRHAKADEAINSFPVSIRKMEKATYEEIREFIFEFGAHVGETIIDAKTPAGTRSPLGFWAFEFLETLYGSKPMIEVERRVRTGVSGGLLGIMRAIAHAYADRIAKQDIGARVTKVCPSLNFEAQMALAEEYYRKYAYLLPEDIVKSGPTSLLWEQGTYLLDHPYHLRRLRKAQRAMNESNG